RRAGGAGRGPARQLLRPGRPLAADGAAAPAPGRAAGPAGRAARPVHAPHGGGAGRAPGWPGPGRRAGGRAARPRPGGGAAGRGAPPGPVARRANEVSTMDERVEMAPPVAAEPQPAVEPARWEALAGEGA